MWVLSEPRSGRKDCDGNERPPADFRMPREAMPRTVAGAKVVALQVPPLLD
jgi:hypothetical protein